MLRSSGPALVIGGCNEFTDAGGFPTVPDTPGLVQAAYGNLATDAGWLSMDEAAALGRSGNPLPFGYAPVDQTPVVQHSVIGEKRIRVVLFPPMREWNDSLVATVLELAHGLRATSDLIVGVSPWGTRLERRFLALAAGRYDVLLGGGPGRGMRGNMDTRGAILWARGFADGKALTVLELMEWPNRTATHVWIENDNVRFPVVSLDASVPADPQLESMLTS